MWRASSEERHAGGRVEAVETEKARRVRALRAIARRQHGVVTRRQALAAGVSVSAMARAVDRGEWKRLHPGIFVVDRAADPLKSPMAAVVLRAPGRTWVSHRSAAALWGLSVRVPVQPDVTTTANLRCGRATFHSVKSMPHEDVSTRYGIPCTLPERTIVDLGRIFGRVRLESVVIEALQKKVADPRRLADRAAALLARGRPGSGALKRILDQWDGGAEPESVLEAKLLRLIRRHGSLPEPARQFEVRDRGQLVGRVDFAYPDQMIAIEADGYRWHSDPAAWRRDLNRRNALTRAGWIVLNFSWDDVRSRPRDVAATIQAAISRRNVPHRGTNRRKVGSAT